MAITKVNSEAPMQRKGQKTDLPADHSRETIHSGHFMISRVHENDPQDDDDDYENDAQKSSVAEDNGFNFQHANKETTDTYKFGTKTITIDDTLNKLFKCMTLAYSGKLTSPKWKPFRGLHLTMKDKVRLNNIIWREWCMQYIYSRTPIICQFACPLLDDVHNKPEAIVLEGKYWKRKLDTVTAEYKKWRKYFKGQLKNSGHSAAIKSKTDADLFAQPSHTPSFMPQLSSTDLLMNTTDFMDIDFNSDQLFSSLNHPFVFPNPRDFSGFGVGDLMQPGLISLQPTLDDYMDLSEPAPDFSPKSQNTIMQFTGNQSNDLSLLLQGDQTGAMSNPSATNEMQFSQSVPQTDDLQPVNNSTALGNLLTGLLGNISNQNAGDSKMSNNSVSFMQTQEVQTQQNVQQIQPQVSFFLPDQSIQNAPSPILPQKSINAHGNQLMTVNLGNSGAKKHSLDGVNSIQEALLKKNVAPNPKPMITTTTPAAGKVGKSHSAPTILPLDKARVLQTQKREFAVPGKPASTRLKQHRTIAPAMSTSHQTITSAPAPSPSQHNTYLAQLLTTGTYPGAIISVKKETVGLTDSPAAPAAIASIQTAPVQTSQSSIVVAPVLNKQLSDLQSSVLIASSPAFGNSITASVDLTTMGSTGNKSQFVVNPTITTSPKPSESPGALDSPMSFTLSSPSSKAETASSPRSTFSPSSPAKLDGEGKDDQRRSSHITSEQKRRCNIKSGFDILHTLIPALSQNPNAKIAKAAMLQKTAEYCKKLKSERTQMQNEAEILRQEIESLNVQISQCQSQLPATGVPVTRQRADQMKTMFEEYVKSRTLRNWKFWIFSTIIRGLFDSFNYMVSTASMEELCRTALAWLDQHCSLVALRPAVLNALRHLSTSTSILSDPSRMPEQANEAVIKGDNALPGNT